MYRQNAMRKNKFLTEIESENAALLRDRYAKNGDIQDLHFPYFAVQCLSEGLGECREDALERYKRKTAQGLQGRFLRDIMKK